jgi:hypothetical protein
MFYRSLPTNAKKEYDLNHGSPNDLGKTDKMPSTKAMPARLIVGGTDLLRT